MTTPWLAAAGQLADDAHQPGFAAAALVASAWCARCLPDATRSLARAAGALTSGGAMERVWDRVPPCPSAVALLQGAEELEGEAVAMRARGQVMAETCEEARDNAIREYQAALRQAANAGTVANGEAVRAGAEQVMADTALVIGDCEAALELLSQVIARLNYAVNCFRRAPDDFAEAYDVPLQFIRDGGLLPLSGDFLTAPATPVGLK
jgi:hypothetical protein